MAIWKRKKSGGDPEDWERDDSEDSFDDSFFGIRDDMFRDFDEQFRRMRAQMNAMMEKAAQGELRSPEQGGPYVYGWSMRVGPDGVPHVQTFGNVQNPAMKGARALPGRPDLASEQHMAGPEGRLLGPGVREPLTDICADDGNITVTAEMPGIERDDIDLETGDDFLVIKVERGERRYYKELELPSKVVAGMAKAKYNNGVLEITLQKAPGEKKGTRVEVE
jgi:HSP20 family protein